MERFHGGAKETILKIEDKLYLLGGKSFKIVTVTIHVGENRDRGHYFAYVRRGDLFF